MGIGPERAIKEKAAQNRIASDPAQVVEEALYHRALCNQAARRGEYHAAMENR